MRVFRCRFCNAPNFVAEKNLGEPKVCTNCNTRQGVPESAAVVPEPLMPNAVPPLHYARDREPDYTLTSVIAYMLMGFAVTGMVVSGLAAIKAESVAVALWGCFAGTIIIALAMLLLRACDIAVNTWHIRHGTIR